MFKVTSVFAFVLYFAFILPAHAEKRKRAVCHGVKDFDTDVSVNYSNYDPELITRYDFLEIEKNRKVDFYKWKHPDEDHFWISDDGSLKSYYRLGVGVGVTTAIKVVPRQQKQGFFCVFLERVKMDLYYDGAVFMDSNFDDIECAQYKTKLTDYMKNRHNQGQGMMMQKRGELLKALSEQISAMERGAVQKSKINLKVSRIQKALKAGAKKYSTMIFDEIVSLNEHMAPNSDLIDHYRKCEAKLEFVAK